MFIKDVKSVPLDALGRRICILGPSNSGKSTLAQALAHKLGMSFYHLDQLAHKPHTKWERRNDADLIREHAHIVVQDEWVIEGNYRICMPPRFDRASFVIWLDPHSLGRVYRYIERSLKKEKGRAGGLEGAQSEFSFELIRHTLFQYPKNISKYHEILSNYPDLPVMKIDKFSQIKSLYKMWDLTRP